MRKNGTPALAAGMVLCLAWCLPGASAATQSEAAPRALSPEMKQQIDALAEGLGRVQQDNVELSCTQAVENARWGVETMLEVGQRNMQDGHLARTDYEATSRPLQALLARLTLSDCETATGARRDFYRCMSSDYNHVYACGKAHPFDP